MAVRTGKMLGNETARTTAVRMVVVMDRWKAAHSAPHSVDW